MEWNGRAHSSTHVTSTGCGKINQPPKKTYISREWYNLNYINLQHLLLRDIA